MSRPASSGLVVVGFDDEQGSLKAAFEDPVLDPVLADVALMVLPVASQASRLRQVFGRPPSAAVCVQTHEGLVLAAHRGPLSAPGIRSLLGLARAGRSAVVAANRRLRAAPGKGSVRLRARWELAEAYLRSGNPFAAYEAYTMVTFGRDPDLAARACQRLARLEVDRGNALEAREWLSHLQDDGPVDASGRVDTAGCQDAQVCLTEALISLREAREAQAMAALAQVVERFPGTAASQRARQELRGLKASAARRK